MADTLNTVQLNQIVSAVLAALQQSGTASKAAPVAQPVDRLAAKDRALIAGLKRKGIPVDQIKLMDRANPKADYNVKPYRDWITAGRQVNKGQHGIRGLFHVSQTSPIAPKAKPSLKAKAKSKPAPATLPLV
jgi:hypothetical protein